MGPRDATLWRDCDRVAVCFLDWRTALLLSTYTQNSHTDVDLDPADTLNNAHPCLMMMHTPNLEKSLAHGIHRWVDAGRQHALLLEPGEPPEGIRE